MSSQSVHNPSSCRDIGHLFVTHEHHQFTNVSTAFPIRVLIPAALRIASTPIDLYHTLCSIVQTRIPLHCSLSRLVVALKTNTKYRQSIITGTCIEVILLYSLLPPYDTAQLPVLSCCLKACISQFRFRIASTNGKRDDNISF